MLFGIPTPSSPMQVKNEASTKAAENKVARAELVDKATDDWEATLAALRKKAIREDECPPLFQVRLTLDASAWCSTFHWRSACGASPMFGSR